MSKFTSTIIIPTIYHVNYLAVGLAGLVRNSRLRHRIIVVFSDYRRHIIQNIGPPKNINIAHVNHPETGEPYSKYKDTYDYIERRGEWCKKHDIEFLDVTEDLIEFQKLWMKNHPFKDTPFFEQSRRYAGGMDTVFKCNMGFRLVDTEWVSTPVWDDDFYPSKGWDVPLFDLAEKHKGKKAVYVPTHVQLFHFDKMPDWKDYWTESRRGFPRACRMLLAMPTIREGHKEHVTNEEWDAFVDRWGKKEVLSEPCAERNLICHIPMFCQTQHLKNIGPPIYPCNYKGAGDGPVSLLGSGFDIEMDDRFHREGFIKYSPCDSFVLHKGFVAFKPEEV